MSFSQINVKAATVTGAVLGFLCWIGGSVLYSLTGIFASVFHGYSALPFALGLVGGAAVGAAIGIVYNWSLRLR